MSVNESGVKRNYINIFTLKCIPGILQFLILLMLPNDIFCQFECVVIDSAYTAPSKPYGKAVGDMDGDGQPDLFISSANGDGMYWYQYPDWEKETIRSAGSWSEDCQISDIDNDGDNDVVNGNKQGLFWYENPLGTNNSWKEHFIGSDGTNIHDLEIADLNGDDMLDVVIRFEKENQKPVTMFLQNDPDDWMVVSNTNSSYKKGEGLATGDLDGDGDIDLALGNVWLENSGNGKKWQEHIYSIEMPEQMILKIADLDLDGRMEIIAAPQSSQTGKLAWYKAGEDRNTLWTEHIVANNITRMHGLGVADFNNDGILDIHTSVRHDNPGEQDNVSIWISNGETVPGFLEYVVDDRGSHFSKIGDIDQDGDIDILGANWSGHDNLHSDVLLWRNLIKTKE